MFSTGITLNVTLARLPVQAVLGRQAGQRHPDATERHPRRLNPPPPNVTLPGSRPLSGRLPSRKPVWTGADQHLGARRHRSTRGENPARRRLDIFGSTAGPIAGPDCRPLGPTDGEAEGLAFR
jgi:hypothetical protein